MADLAAAIAETPKAVVFKDAGPEHFEIVAAAGGSRRRLAEALGVDERDAGKEYLNRLGKPQPMIEVASDVAPVHQVVRKGDDVDLTRLPFHLQHELDGGVYISASIDYAVDPATGKRNVGCRRLMLRSRDTMRANLTDASDLKLMYLACLKRGERLPVSYVIGSHPLDYLAATQKQPVDEFALVGTVRGEPVPMVRGVTNGIYVPADAEAVIEGYFDELGYREMEGPYGEFYGYYGSMHIDPVFHATAITMRRDAMFQTVLHAGRFVGRMDSANLASLNAEVNAWRALRAARIEPVAINFVLASNGRQHCRVSLKRGAPGQARLAIAALFALPTVKHAFIVDEDVDVFSDEEVEWAMATRFSRRARHRGLDRDARVLCRPDGGQGRAGREGGLRLHRAAMTSPTRSNIAAPLRRRRRPACSATAASPKRCKPRRCISASWSPRSAAPTAARSRSRSTCCASRTW